jgi:hypothetical protein
MTQAIPAHRHRVSRSISLADVTVFLVGPLKPGIEDRWLAEVHISSPKVFKNESNFLRVGARDFCCCGAVVLAP